MFHNLVPLHGDLVLGLLLEVVQLDDVLGDVAQLVVGEDVIDQGDVAVLHVVGEIPQLGDGLPDAVGEFREDEEEQEAHQEEEIDEVLVDGERRSDVGVEPERGAVDVAVDVGRRVEIADAGRL